MNYCVILLNNHVSPFEGPSYPVFATLRVQGVYTQIFVKHGPDVDTELGSAAFQ